MPTNPAFRTATTFTSLASAAVLGLGVLTLTACQSDDTGAAPSSTASSPAAPSAGTSGTSAPAPATSAPAAPKPAASHSGDDKSGKDGTTGKTGTSGASKGGGSDPNGDEYAFTHPCTPQQLSVQVTARAGAPSQRVIAVRNTGKHSCGLSYYPLVHLDNAKDPNGEHAVHPMIPSGLGGAPAYPVRPSATAYAVIDLNPTAATTGTVPGINELNVLPDADHMPNAATLNFPLPASTPVLHPKLGLYRSTVPDAVSSMQSADYQS